jgi:hypothetical protein
MIDEIGCVAGFSRRAAEEVGGELKIAASQGFKTLLV